MDKQTILDELLALLEQGGVSVRTAALGGGGEIPLLFDTVLAGDDAKFAFPEIQLACYPPVAMAILSDQVGPKRAADLILTGRIEVPLAMDLIPKMAKVLGPEHQGHMAELRDRVNAFQFEDAMEVLGRITRELRVEME